MWLAIGALAVVVVVALVFAGRAARKTDKRATPHEKRVRALLVVFGIVAAGIALIATLTDSTNRWIWIAGIIPGYLGIQHGINTAIFKSNYLFGATQPTRAPSRDARITQANHTTVEFESKYYSVSSLTLRYVLPSLILALSIIVGGDLLAEPPWIIQRQLEPAFAQGVTLGAAGAYLYVLVYIGKRTMQGDITPASLIWSTVTMVGGPLFGGVIHTLVQSKTDGDPGSLGLGAKLVPFAAGFSMRLTVEFVQSAIRRVFFPRAADPRSSSLLQIRGITNDVEERLQEEGIADVANLAYANPLRLRRNTRFDKQQILSWIDEALLIEHLPTAWSALEADGITGAIDLIWYVDQVAVQTPGSPLGPTPAAPATWQALVASPSINDLAQRNKLNVDRLADIMLRMYDDAQVKLIWGLYRLEEADDGDLQFRNFSPEDIETQAAAPGPAQATDLAQRRNAIYADHRGLFLVHTWQHSPLPNQLVDIIIKVERHKPQRSPPPPIARVVYCLGGHFFNGAEIPKSNAAEDFCVCISAYGPALCVARVEFSDGHAPVILYRYLDFDLEAA